MSIDIIISRRDLETCEGNAGVHIPDTYMEVKAIHDGYAPTLFIGDGKGKSLAVYLQSNAQILALYRELQKYFGDAPDAALIELRDAVERYAETLR